MHSDTATLNNLTAAAQKPVVLYKWQLSTYAKPGWKILDTHSGSGSLMIACIDLGFDYIAFEKDYDYYRDSYQWVNNYKAQLKLF